MTAAELVAQGVVFIRFGPYLLVEGPVGRADLLQTLRDEVARRVPHLCELPKATAGRYGQCEGCGDAIAHYTAGFCPLCSLARRKALELAGMPPLPPPPLEQVAAMRAEIALLRGAVVAAPSRPRAPSFAAPRAPVFG